MKKINLALIVAFLFVTQSFVLAERTLDRTEILQILRTITSNPRETWISSGTIQATHNTYNALTGQTVISDVEIKYDGTRFYWEIDIDSQNSVEQLKSYSSEEEFDLNLNKSRIFVWDGENYTMYFKSSGHSITAEQPTNTSPLVNGALTAGIIPWGYGFYTYESLCEAEIFAEATEVYDNEEIHLTIKKMGFPTLSFVIDPTKDYSVLSCTMNNSGGSLTKKEYFDYQLVADRWVPTSVVIERNDTRTGTSKLISYDNWEFTYISPEMPQPESFNAAYENDVLVEYHSPSIDKPLSYYHSDKINASLLLKSKLANIIGTEQTGNCATKVLGYVLPNLGKEVDEPNLIKLINSATNKTSLYALKQFVTNLELYSIAGRTNLNTLRGLNNCQIILHLSENNHYVILGGIDENKVWIIDLESQKFLYNEYIDEFVLGDWEGVAFVVSDSPINLPEGFSEFNEVELHQITGASIPKFSCSELIQAYDIAFCSEMISGGCGGWYRTWYNRWGCAEDENGGQCTGTPVVGNVSSLCVEDLYYPGYCDITGTWYSQYIRACQ